MKKVADKEKELEQEKMSIDELVKQVEERKATLSAIEEEEKAAKTAVERSKQDLEAQLAALTAEYDVNNDKKLKVKQKQGKVKDEVKKKIKRDKEKLEKLAKSHEDKKNEILAEIEQEQLTKQALEGSTTTKKKDESNNNNNNHVGGKHDSDEDATY